MNITYQFKKLYYKGKTIFQSADKLVKINYSQKVWEKQAQAGELDFHKVNTWRNSPEFMIDTALLLDGFGFTPSDYIDRTILDLGAGSKLRSKYFKESRIIVLEPLANKFIKEIDWCDLDTAKVVYSIPAEQLVEELINTIDFAMSINVLDHCFDFGNIIKNLHKYLKKDGLAFLSFDSHLVPDDMHPLILTAPICQEIFQKNGFVIKKMSKGFVGGFKDKYGVDTYGHGKYCLNYWLKKIV